MSRRSQDPGQEGLALPRLLQDRIGWAATLVVAVVAGTILVANWSSERDRQALELDRELELIVEEPAALLEQTLDRSRRNVRFLTQVPPIRGLVRAYQNDGLDPIENTSTELWRSRLHRIFTGYIDAHEDVTQVRYIGAADGGLEIVRVHRSFGAVAVVPKGALQAKGHRDYVKETLTRRPRDVVVSSFNLNREHGRVQMPPQPTARISTPVYDEQGNAFGLIVINLDLTDHLRRITAEIPRDREVYLVNSDGDFLIHPDKARAFGFDLGRPHRFRDEFTHSASPRAGLHRYARGEQQLYARTERVVLDTAQASRYVDLFVMAPATEVTAAASEATSKMAVLVGMFACSGLVMLMLYRTGVQRRLQAHQERARLAAIVDGSADAIIGLDTRGHVLDWNRGAEEVLGYGARAAMGQPIRDLLELQQDETSTALTAAAEEPSTLELRCRRKDGTAIDISLTRSPVRGASGVLAGSALIVRDITEEKRNRERIQQLNESLEQQIAERTASLEAARAEAEASNLAKGQFLANMTHEIRTPMNAILGTLQLLRGAHLNRAQLRYTETAQSAAKTLLRTLNDILDYSKIEAGKLTLHEHPFRLDAMLRDVGTVMMANLGSKPVQVLFDIEPDLPLSVVGDALRLEQVLLNLLGNAIKFTEAGHVVLSVKGERGLKNQVRLSFAIVDSGIGMTPHQIERIFEGFTQAEASTTRRFGGTGLGLTICRHLVELMGGELHVDSAPGSGSAFRFTISFPLAEGTDRHRIAPGKLELLHGLQVLVVGEPGVARETMTKTMGQFGWSTIAADGAHEALRLRASQIAQGHDVDIVAISGELEAAKIAEIARAIDSDSDAEGSKRPILLLITSMHGQATLAATDPELEQRLHIVLRPTTASQIFEAVAAAMLSSEGADTRMTEAPATDRLAGLRLLLVDDNRLNQQIAAELLEKEGAHVTIADNGQVSVDHLRETPDGFDAVLMDVHMPVLDGHQATRVIRGELGIDAEQLPVIAMTANVSSMDRVACLDAGMNDHVGKPFHLDDLVNKVLDCTSPARPRAQAQGEAAQVRTARQVEPAADGFDFDAAAARMGGDRELLARTAAGFCKRYEDSVRLWRLELDRIADPETAARIKREAHTLKGLAATIGALRLTERAAAFEKQAVASADRESLEAALDAVDEALEEAVIALRAELPQLDDGLANPQHGQADNAAGAGLERLDSLVSALGSNNMRALDVHAEMQDALTGIAPDLAQPLDDALERLDFAAAYRICGELRERLDG